MKQICKIVFVIIGTMIGAGFASGQEVYLFFFSYGLEGIIGLIISSIIMGVVIYKTFQIVNKFGINNYKDFLSIILKKNSKLKPIINLIINSFILITFFIMIAGFGAYFEQELGISNFLGSTLLAFITFLIFMTNVKGVVKANELLVPFLIGFLVFIGILNLKGLPFKELGNYITKTNSSNFILSAILYGSYNSILLIPVLITLKDYIKNKKQIIKIAIISTKLEMPAIYVVSNSFKILRYIYGFVILGSIFTTAISLGTSFLQNTTKNKKSYTQIAIIMCITSVLVSNIGFSNLVNGLYPIFGYLGIIQIIKLSKNYVNK